MNFFAALAIVLNIIYLILVYYGIFLISRAIYRRGAVWLVAFLIFLSPFALTLVVVESLAGLMWVLALTPFISVAMLMIHFTNWILLYYGLAYSILFVSYYMLRNIRSLHT